MVIGVNRGLLATTDPERAHSDELFTDAADKARADIAAINGLDLPAEVDEALTSLFGSYEEYLSAEQEAMVAAKATDPAGPAAKKVLADDDEHRPWMMCTASHTPRLFNCREFRLHELVSPR
jgi:methyl-accepting chemotaxis protein